MQPCIPHTHTCKHTQTHTHTHTIYIYNIYINNIFIYYIIFIYLYFLIIYYLYKCKYKYIIYKYKFSVSFLFFFSTVPSNLLIQCCLRWPTQCLISAEFQWSTVPSLSASTSLTVYFGAFRLLLSALDYWVWDTEFKLQKKHSSFSTLAEMTLG